MTDGEKQAIFPLVSTKKGLKCEAAKRQGQCEFISVKTILEEGYIKDGWEIDKRLKQKVRLKKIKPIDAQLEGRVWMLFYRLGYSELNEGRQFRIQIKRKDAEPYDKQIDVFAKDDETVIVAECKASEDVRKRSLQKDVEEFSNLKGPIASAVREYYGRDFKPKIIWLFVTQNILWSDPDRERATGSNIQILTQRELTYYEQICEHLGRAAKYQVMAEFLHDQKIPELKDREVPAIRGKLGKHVFYCFAATPAQLLKVSFVNHRSLNDPDGVPTYQRLIKRSRINNIAKFLGKGGFFPTNILLNFTRPARFVAAAPKSDDTGSVYGMLFLPERYRSAWVIDGQHRLYGYAKLDEVELNQHVIVVAFDDMDANEQADMFLTINHEQKSVPRNLLDDLDGELRWGSSIPAVRISAIAARLTSVLNNDNDSPFYERITRQGITATDKTNLTVPQLKDGFKKSGLVGTVELRQKEYLPGPLCDHPDELTLKRARKALNVFFDLIRDANPGQWDMGKRGFLCTNIAVQGYMRLMGDLIKFMEQKTSCDARQLTEQELVDSIAKFIEPVLSYLRGASDETMQRDFDVVLGAGGPGEYRNRLCRQVYAKFNDFAPEGYPDWLAAQSEEKIKAADDKLKKLGNVVLKHIFDDVLKPLYGLEKDNYFHKGIVDTNIKGKALTRMAEAGDNRVAPENYLDFIDYKKIVENKEHWPLFKDVFDIPELGEKGQARNLKWIDRFNELRRISAHPGDRQYTTEDFKYIDYIFSEFKKRISAKVGT